MGIFDANATGTISKVAVALVMACAAWGSSVYALPQYDPHDPIDLNFGVREALERVERALICHEGTGVADRSRTLRLLGALDSRRGRGGHYISLSAWAVKDIGGGERGVEYACANLFRLAGELYGCPDIAARGRRLEADILAAGPAPEFRPAADMPASSSSSSQILLISLSS